jgi:hypothetical protein
LKKRTSILLSIVMVLVMATPAFAAVNLNVNGRDYQPTNETYLENGVTMVTLDVITNTLGCEVSIQDSLITFMENDNIIQMTLGSTTAVVNGIEMTIPRAPEIINGNIYIPLRFVYESLGAVVNWQGQSNTVAITYNETRDGMTAEELMVKSTAIMNEAGRYKMTVDIKSLIDATIKEAGNEKQSMQMNMDADVEAWLQMDPIIMYLKQKATIDMPEAPNPAPQAIETEMLMNQEGIFMTMPEIGWVKMELQGLDFQELMKQSMTQDPTAVMQQMKDMGMSISFANDKERNGKQYWILNGTMGSDLLKSEYFQQISQQLTSIGPEIDMQKLLENTDFNFVYSTWIDKDTFYNDYMDLAGTIKFNMEVPATEESPGGSMDMAMDMQANYTISDYGKEFSTPEVKDARSFEEVMAEQMAGSQNVKPIPEPLPEGTTELVPPEASQSDL